MLPSSFVMCFAVSLYVPFSFFYHFPYFCHGGFVVDFLDEFFERGFFAFLQICLHLA